MRRFLMAVAWTLLGVSTAQASFTLVARENFQGVGTVNAAVPGGLGAVSQGALYKRPVGPRVAGAAAPGWSAQARADAPFIQSYDLSTPAYAAAANAGALGGWVRFESVTTDGQPHPTDLVQIVTRYGDSLDFGLDGAGQLVYTPINGSYTATGYILAPYTWYYVLMEWRVADPANGPVSLRLSVQPLGGALTPLASFKFAVASAVPRAVGFRNAAQYGGGVWGGRLGGVSLASIGAIGEGAVPADLLPPAAAPTAWYCNPATGNDTGDGLSPATAWRTVDKINDESLHAGLLGTAGGYAAGDTLVIDTGGANLPLGPAGLLLNTRGLNVAQTGAGELQAWAALPPGGWTPVSGSARTFQQPLSEANPSCVLWENDLWLNHPTGASLAAVQAALDAVPGSFWTDGATMYVHPFGDTDPRADGKAYTRSYHRGQPYGTAAVLMLAPEQHLSGLRVRKTCLAVMDTSDPVAGYCFQTGGTADGAMLVENCQGSDGSKHIFGFTDFGTAKRLLVRDCAANQGSPYAQSGGQTPWVDYSPLSADADNQTTYLRCSTTANAGLIGSTAGQSPVTTYNAWISHNNGPGLQFSQLRFDSCSFDCTLNQEAAGKAGSLQAVNTVCAGLAANSAGATVDRCLSTAFPFTCQSAGNGLAVTNSIVRGSQDYYALNPNCQAAGAVSYVGCTVDLRAALSGNASSGGDSFLARVGALHLTVQNCVFLSTPDGYSQLSLVSGAGSSDTLSLDHNAYQLGVNGIVVAAYNDGTTTANRTLAQWQALGFDASSFATADPKLSAGYLPLPGSPLIHAGANLGSAPDYTGRVFTARDAIGALQPPPTTFADWQSDFFTAAQQASPAVSGPAAAPAGDGVANLLKYAFNLDPRAPASAASLPAAAFAAGAVSLTYRQSDYAADLRYTVESSSDLLRWSVINPALTTLSDDGVTRQVRAQVPADGTARRFLRLRVSR